VFAPLNKIGLTSQMCNGNLGEGWQGGTQDQGAVAIVAPGGRQAGRMGRRNLTPEAKRDLGGSGEYPLARHAAL
jgi:hypothetical protein